MSRFTSWDEQWASLPASTRAAIEKSVADAPPFPPETRDVLRRVFAGAGERMAAAQQNAA